MIDFALHKLINDILTTFMPATQTTIIQNIIAAIPNPFIVYLLKLLKCEIYHVYRYYT